MCGIAGAMVWDDRGRNGDLQQMVTRMTDALSHRGPDGWGVARVAESSDGALASPEVAFGHRRLAIIDLSPRAAQPMANAARDTWLTFNGEIYNFKAIRQDLEARGRVFRSDSDTEVLLQGYEEWGTALVGRLRGMFAAAVWDGRQRELVLLRDRLGIKPLYVWKTDCALLFASEVRALLASGIVPRRLDPVGLEQFLACQAVPAPRTLVDGVRLLEPAHVLRVGSDGHVVDEAYWDLIDSAETVSASIDVQRARSRVRELLVESTDLHLVSDVPVGVFLSAGIDSSAIAALVREAAATPRTFTVTFPGHPYDEGPEARTIAAALGTEHEEIPLRPVDVCRRLPEALGQMDQPSGDGVNTFVVARAVHDAGLKVALSGLGGDELFGGYPSFRRARRLAGLARWFQSPRPARQAAAAIVRQVGRSSVSATKAAAILETDGSLARTFPVFRELFSAGQRRDLLDDASSADKTAGEHPYETLIEGAEARGRQLGLSSMITFAEARTYMHDVLLRDTDQMSMACGLEVRVPLLDHRLVEYVMGLPDRVKTGAGTKPLLVDSLGDTLPAAVRRTGKRGFVLPLEDWMRGDLREFCETHLEEPALARIGLRASTVQRLWTTFQQADRRTRWSRPWTLVALSAWAARHGLER